MAMYPVSVRIHLTGLIALVPRLGPGNPPPTTPIGMLAVLVDPQDSNMPHRPEMFWREDDADWVTSAFPLKDRRVSFQGAAAFSLQNHLNGFGTLPRSPSDAGYWHWLPKLKDLGISGKPRATVTQFPTQDPAVAGQVELQHGMMRTQRLAEYNSQIVKLKFGNTVERAAAIAVVLEETLMLDDDGLQVDVHNLQTGNLTDQFRVAPYSMGPNHFVDVLISNSSVHEHQPFDEAHHFTMLCKIFGSPKPNVQVPKVSTGMGADPGLQPGIGGLWNIPASLAPSSATPHQHGAPTGNLNSRPICPMAEVDGP